MRNSYSTKLSIAVVLLQLLSACSGKGQSLSLLRLAFPKYAATQKSGEVTASAFDTSQYCFAANIISVDVPSKRSSICDPEFGILAGSVDSDGILEIQVPRGRDRKVTIFAIQKNQGTSCPSVSEGFGSVDRQKVFLIGEQHFDVLDKEATVEVSVTNPMPENSLQSQLSLPLDCTSSTPAPTPSPAPKIRSVYQGGAARIACSIWTNGQLQCWGANSTFNAGQVGNGTLVDVSSPTDVDIGTSYRYVSIGSGVTCGITTSGTLKCWGKGGVGDGTTTTHSLPTVVDVGVAYTQISTKSGHRCGITTAGVLKCWGGNT